MAIQELLEVLLLDVCLFLGICCMAAIRPAQLTGSQGLHPVNLISKGNTFVGCGQLFAAKYRL